MSKYDDIINTKYPFGLGHPRMSMLDRASQFAPFAALTGYEEAIEETARQTDSFIMLDEEALRDLNEKLNYLSLNKNTKVEIEYFIKDDKKEGGVYKTLEGIVKNVDDVNKFIILSDKTKIEFNRLLSIKIL